MMKTVKTVIKRLIGRKDLPPPETLLDKVYGHKLSQDLGKPVWKDGSPIPWYTYSAVEFLEQFDLGNKTVFEWGCGNSSLFFAQRCKSVTSLEHDKAWYDQMVPLKRSNQQIEYISLGDYPAGIKKFGQQFDIIVIDGQRRFDCTREAFPFLRDNGIIIVDNSDWFYVSCALLREKYGMRQIDFHGFGSINSYTTTTSVFFSPNFDFPLKKGRQPLNSKGGLLHDEKEIIKNEDAIFHTDNYIWMENGFR